MPPKLRNGILLIIKTCGSASRHLRIDKKTESYMQPT